MEATGKCHLGVTRKKKTKQNHSHCGHPRVCNSWSCPSITCPFSLLSAATSSFLSSSSEHEVSRFRFFWSKSHLGQNGALQQRGSSELHSLCFTHTLKVLPQPAELPEAAAGTALARMGHGANAIFDSRGSSHQAQPRQKVWQGTQGSRTRAGLLSRTIPPVEQFPISPFHQHQVIQFQFCTSWVYLARRETSSLLSSC